MEPKINLAIENLKDNKNLSVNFLIKEIFEQQTQATKSSTNDVKSDIADQSEQ